MMKQVWERNIVAATVLLFVCAAVYLNWRYASNVTDAAGQGDDTKILGQSIGISSLWVLFSIVVGGDLFGLVGMVVGVPLFATLYGLLQEIVHFLLERRGIDGEGNPLPDAEQPAKETVS